MVSQRHVIIKQYSNQTLATQAQNFYLKVSLIFSPPLSDSTGRRQELQIHFFYGCFTPNFHFGKLHKPFFTQQKFRMETFRSSPQSKLLLKHYYSLHGLFSAPYLRVIISGFKNWFSDGGTLVISSRMCYLEFIHFMQLSIENKH